MEKKEKKFLIKLDEKLHRRVKISAAQRNISMLELIRNAIAQHLEEDKQSIGGINYGPNMD